MTNPLHQVSPSQVGQMYALFAEAIRTGQSRLPTFDTAVDLHRFVDIMHTTAQSLLCTNNPAVCRNYTPGTFVVTTSAR